jgi:hypothetical protein
MAVPNALDLPDDLIALARTRAAAERAMEAAARTGGDLDAARQAFIDAALTVEAHPLLEQARQEGCRYQTWQALLDAVKTPGP